MKKKQTTELEVDPPIPRRVVTTQLHSLVQKHVENNKVDEDEYEISPFLQKVKQPSDDTPKPKALVATVRKIKSSVEQLDR